MKKKIECNLCFEKKPAKQFSKDKRTKTGYAKYCSHCAEFAGDERKKKLTAKRAAMLNEKLTEVRKTMKLYSEPYEETLVCPACHKIMKIKVGKVAVTVNVPPK